MKAQTTKLVVYYCFYFVFAALLVVPALVRASLMIYRGFQSSCVNFFCNYIAQATAAFLFVQLAWPPYSKDKDDLMDVGFLADRTKRKVQFESP